MAIQRILPRAGGVKPVGPVKITRMPMRSFAWAAKARLKAQQREPLAVLEYQGDPLESVDLEAGTEIDSLNVMVKTVADTVAKERAQKLGTQEHAAQVQQFQSGRAKTGEAWRRQADVSY